MLVGPSGCGKTTTLRMVNRMITPTSGTISINGRDTASLDVAELRRGIGYVIQHAGLFPHRTILDNVTTVPRLLGLDKRKARARAHGAASSGSASSRLSPSATRPSSRGASSSASALPGPWRPTRRSCSWTSRSRAVDPVVREQLQNEFLRLQSEIGKTILFVTHDIDEADQAR